MRLINAVGERMTHRQRRYVLDKLGLAKLLRRYAADAFDEVALHDGRMITINRLYHAHLAKDGRVAYEDDVFDALHAACRPGAVFWDIGANVGVFSFDAMTMVGPEGQVVAFEPEPNNSACFRRTLGRLEASNVTLHDCAVGAADGEMSFDRRGGAFSGRLAPEGGHDVVTVRSADSLVAEGVPVPDVIKIDVEGGEGAVVAGMGKLLEAHAPVLLIELHPFVDGAVEATARTLRAAGYALHDLSWTSVDDPLPRHILVRKA